MACQGLGKLVSVFLWVELDLFSLECNGVSVLSFAVSLGSLYFNAQGYVPAFMEN